MHRHRTAVSGAALVVMAATLGLAGCSHDNATASSPVPPGVSLIPSMQTATMQSAALPAGAVLTGVLYRLADPAVPGSEKVDLIEAAKPDAAGTLDRFVVALRDGGYAPLTFDATDITWSDREPGTAVATVNVATANAARSGTAGFSFPMEFKPHGDGWQLSQKTAALLLAFGDSHLPATPAGPASPAG